MHVCRCGRKFGTAQKVGKDLVCKKVFIIVKPHNNSFFDKVVLCFDPAAIKIISFKERKTDGVRSHSFRIAPRRQTTALIQRYIIDNNRKVRSKFKKENIENCLSGVQYGPLPGNEIFRGLALLRSRLAKIVKTGNYILVPKNTVQAEKYLEQHSQHTEGSPPRV